MAARIVLMLVLVLACQGARADTEIRLLQSFAGNVNFVGTQETVRDKNNQKACQVRDPSKDIKADVSGIPGTAIILSAQLYWAASNNNPDFSIIFDGATVKAPLERRYYSGTIGNDFNYYSGAADVTEQVRKKRNATYAFRGLTVNSGAPYCAVEGVLGGFSLLVIYSDASEPFRMLNLYEGFQYMRHSGITLNLSGFRVPDPIGTATGRLAHITWEGDSTIDGFGENLTLNGYEMADPHNKSGNQFNSRSSINNDNKSYGIDFDAYTVEYPVIKPGQATASTRYETGQDMVLLSAEVVALPNIPFADLSIAMQLVGGELTTGKNASYTIQVANAGPSTESGPTVVTSTLPAGLSYVSGSGSGWSCGSVGSEVTCTSTSALPSGSSLPVLTLTVGVTGTGTITNSALVTGKTFDPQMANNAVSVKGVVDDGSSAYIFTDGACVPGLKLDHPDQTCTKVLPQLRAGVTTPIYITAVLEDVPTAAGDATKVSMEFALSCHNPSSSAGVAASYAGTKLKECASNSGEPTLWSDLASISFEANSPSAKATFKYDDVGLVQLYMRSGADQAIAASLPFVSVPYEIRLSSKGAAFPELPLNENSSVFARAGVLFDLEAGSYAFDTADTALKLTPNFGRELPARVFSPPTIEKGAVMGSKASSAMDDIPDGTLLTGAFGNIVKGKAVGKFSWPEVGVIKLTPALNFSDYLGKPYTVKSAYAGRFIPHHFTTSAQQMDCVPNMRCDVDTDISTAAYSKEPIAATITAEAYGGTPTKNYRGVYARNVKLSAWEDPNKGYKLKLGLSKVDVAATDFKNDDGTAQAQPVFTLEKGFVHSEPQAEWSAPTSIYLRADETGGDGVTSLSTSDPHEVGIRIVSGRLMVPNAHGSERLNLPLKVNAQYWTGTNWELSRTDQKNEIDPAKAEFSNFGGGISATYLSLLPEATQMLSAGAANFNVKVAPAVAGRADLLINDVEWLPSTKGRLKFGTHKSPLVYLRELH